MLRHQLDDLGQVIGDVIDRSHSLRQDDRGAPVRREERHRALVVRADRELHVPREASQVNGQRIDEGAELIRIRRDRGGLHDDLLEERLLASHLLQSVLRHLRVATVEEVDVVDEDAPGDA